MTYQNDFTLSETLLEQLTTSGLEALPTLFQVLLNAAMQIERQKHLGAAPHERTEQRNGHANGFKDKTLHTRIGQVTVAVPQVREVRWTRRWLLSTKSGTRHPLRAGLEAGAGRDVGFIGVMSRAFLRARWPPSRSSSAASRSPQ